jgi:LysR family transcriptional regulator, regulator for metE and metH
MNRLHDPDRLEIRHLKLVRAIAEAGSVTRAASTLHLSQSAVSHQLLDLERDLGQRLFDRIGKRMVPTRCGAYLIVAATRLLGELGELERSLDDQRGSRVPLRIASSCFTSYHWLPAALAHFGKHHPNVELEIVLEATRRTGAALAADEIDLAVTTKPPQDDTWQTIELMASELVALASKRHPVVERTRRGGLPWTELHDCEILVHDVSDEDLERLARAVRAGNATAPVKVRKIPLSEALLELVRAGYGVAIVDRWVVSPYLTRELVALPMAPRTKRIFHAVWRRANPRRLPIKELVDIIGAAGERAAGS